MTLEERLREDQEEMQKLVDELNQLESKKQALYPQIFRLEGSLKVLQELIKEQNS